MTTADWIKALTNLGPYIVAVTALVMWSLESIFSRRADRELRQTELLERIAAQFDKSQS